MFHLFMLGMLSLIIVLYLFMSPRDTFAELKLVFDPGVIRRGLRVRLPRRLRLPSITFPPIRFSILGLLTTTALIAIYIGFMQAKAEPLWNAIIMASVLIAVVGVSLMIGWNAQGRGVLRRQRANYQPVGPESRAPQPSIKVDSRHETKLFDGKSFPKLQVSSEDSGETAAPNV